MSDYDDNDWPDLAELIPPGEPPPYWQTGLRRAFAEVVELPEHDVPSEDRRPGVEPESRATLADPQGARGNEAHSTEDDA